MYHLELRKFPHVVCRFNQSEAQLRALVIPWTRQEWIEEGERKWNINEATLTILEGPKLSMPDLAMGKGWRNAQKRSEDVTERVLGAAREGVTAARASRTSGLGAGGTVASGSHPAEQPASGDLGLLADSLGLEVLGTLDAGSVPLGRVWQLAHERLDGGSPSESLALAELAVGSLLGRKLVVLRRGDAEPADAALGEVQSWMGDGAETVAIARSG